MALVHLNYRWLQMKKTNEGRLLVLSRASDAFNKILSIDPNYAAAKTQ